MPKITITAALLADASIIDMCPVIKIRYQRVNAAEERLSHDVLKSTLAAIGR